MFFIKFIIQNGIWIYLNDKEFFISFDAFPMLKELPVAEIFVRDSTRLGISFGKNSILISNLNRRNNLKTIH